MTEPVQKHIAAKTGITREEFIGAFAGNDYFVAGTVHVPAHQQLRDAESIVDRAFGVPVGLHEIIVEMRRVQS